MRVPEWSNGTACKADDFVGSNPTSHSRNDIKLSDTMKIESQLSFAIAIAAVGHQNQFDRGGRPYFLHCQAVADKCEADTQKIVAYLHDVIEDTIFKENDLRVAGIDSDLVDAVVLLTKVKNQSEDEYYAKLKLNPLAKYVKIRDLEHNMDLSRLKRITEKDKERHLIYRQRHWELVN